MNRRSFGDQATGLAWVGLAVLLFSTSPVLIRLATDFNAFEITFARMAVAAVLMQAVVLITGQRLPELRTAAPAFLFYGAVTALHFLLYSASLFYTSIAHSLVLVYTAPLFIAVMSYFVLREPIQRRQLPGLALAVLGIAVLTGFEPNFTPRMLLGDLMALGSAFCFGIYSVAGRRVRSQVPLIPYVAAVYTLAALWLIPAAVFAGLPHAEAPGFVSVASVVALGVFPVAIGHTLYNVGLRRTHATYVNLIATQEVTGGMILSFLILGEQPTPNSLLGAALTLLGIAIVLVFAKGTTAPQANEKETG